MHHSIQKQIKIRRLQLLANVKILKFDLDLDLECKDKDKDKNLFIGPQEFVVRYSNAPEQPQSSARPICHSHTMMRSGHEPATIRIAA